MIRHRVRAQMGQRDVHCLVQGHFIATSYFLAMYHVFIYFLVFYGATHLVIVLGLMLVHS